MFLRIGVFGRRGSLSALLWCVFAVGLLLAEPGEGRAQTSEGADATEQLFEAVYANDFAAVQAAVAAGANVDLANQWGMTPMELAIDKGYFEIGHYLVAVRNFSRAKTDDRPAAPVVSRSPYGAASSDELAARPPGPVSPLGPLSKPANNNGSDPSASGDLDLETSAGGPAASSGKANPFDPNAPAYGSGAFSAGNTPGTFFGGAGDGNRLTGEGESGNTAADASVAAGLPDRTSAPSLDDSPNGTIGAGRERQ